MRRAELRDITGLSGIPVLIAGASIVEGEARILAYLAEHFPEPVTAAEQRAKAEKARNKELEEACPKLAAATR